MNVAYRFYRGLLGCNGEVFVLCKKHADQYAEDTRVVLDPASELDCSLCEKEREPLETKTPPRCCAIDWEKIIAGSDGYEIAEAVKDNDFVRVCLICEDIVRRELRCVSECWGKNDQE